MAKPEGQGLKERLELSEHKRLLLQKRLSKSSIEEDSTLWSFVDLMTLLLILFILFYSHAMTHKNSAEYMTSKNPQTPDAQSFEVHKASMALEPVAYDPDRPEPDAVIHAEEQPDEALEQFEEQVLQTVSEKVKKDFSIRWNQRRLVLVLGERIAFNVGEADLLPDFQPTLKQIAEFITSQEGYRVTVAGHTDDTPINNARFKSNWELSAIRAVNVAKFMVSNGVDPNRISTEGYSAYRPLQPNTTDDNKQANRRVEITLIKAEETEKSDEEMVAIPVPGASLKSTQAAILKPHSKNRHHNVRGYPF
jgi:chemotaxis protein MotB